MKCLFTLFFLLCLTIIGVTQSKNRTFESANGTINILGHASLERLKEDPFRDWYSKSYDEYEVVMKAINTSPVPDSVTIFMGTWCGDSRREVPRFVKILEETEFSFDKLKIICVNTGFQNYKQSPEREEAGLSIHRVPTFILHHGDGAEIGRIVEEPVVSLEQDFSDIMEGKPYETAYPVANDLMKKFDSHSLTELRKMMSSFAKEYAGKATSEYELNTYGYVLWTSFDLVKAEFVFELNTMLYPESSRPFGMLARFKENLGKKKEALASLKKGLTIDPENNQLVSMKENLENENK